MKHHRQTKIFEKFQDKEREPDQKEVWNVSLRSQKSFEATKCRVSWMARSSRNNKRKRFCHTTTSIVYIVARTYVPRPSSFRTSFSLSPRTVGLEHKSGVLWGRARNKKRVGEHGMQPC